MTQNAWNFSIRPGKLSKIREVHADQLPVEILAIQRSIMTVMLVVTQQESHLLCEIKSKKVIWTSLTDNNISHSIRHVGVAYHPAHSPGLKKKVSLILGSYASISTRNVIDLFGKAD